MELEEVSVPALSVGRLLLPRFWTVDAHSHYVPVSYPGRASFPSSARNTAPAPCGGGSSNTVRAERLDRSGDTMYLAEVYIPRVRGGDGAIAGASSLAAAQNACLASVPPRRENRPPLQVWVRNVEEDMSRISAQSMAGQLLPSYHIFLQLVLDVFEGPSREMAAMVQIVLADTFAKLTTPLRTLCAPPATQSNGANHISSDGDDQRRGGGGAGGHYNAHHAPQEQAMENSWWNTARARLTGQEDPAFSVGVYTTKGAAVVSAPLLFTDGGDGGAGSAFDVEWNSGRCHRPKAAWEEVPGLAASARLRHFAKHELRLHVGEELIFALAHCDNGSHTDALPVEAVSVATFPVLTRPSTCSLYNYLSIERAFEEHVRTSLEGNARRRRVAEPASDAAGTLQQSPRWELTRVRTSDRFIPTEAYMHAVTTLLEEEVSLSPSAEAGPGQQCMPFIPIRHTLYTLKAAGSTRDASFVAQLVSPRVQSDSAIVLLAAVSPSYLGNLSDVAEKLPRLFTVEYPALCQWTAALRTPSLLSSNSSTGGGGGGGGFLFRQGQLVLRLDGGDARYHAVRVAPTAGQCFSSLGSLTVSRARPAFGVGKLAGEEQPAVPSSSSASASSAGGSPGPRARDAAGGGGLAESYAALAASWTLVADGRSAVDYLDYVLTEAYYDSGVFHLSNVAQRATALTLHKNSLWVRERGRNTTHRLRRLQQRRANHGAAVTDAAVGGGGEVWSAWVDVDGGDRRIFVCAQERDVGQLLVIQAAIAAPPPAHEAATGEREGIAAARPEVERQEEAEMEAWVFGVTVGCLPRY